MRGACACSAAPLRGGPAAAAAAAAGAVPAAPLLLGGRWCRVPSRPVGREGAAGRERGRHGRRRPAAGLRRSEGGTVQWRTGEAERGGERGDPPRAPCGRCRAGSGAERRGGRAAAADGEPATPGRRSGGRSRRQRRGTAGRGGRGAGGRGPWTRRRRRRGRAGAAARRRVRPRPGEAGRALGAPPPLRSRRAAGRGGGGGLGGRGSPPGLAAAAALAPSPYFLFGFSLASPQPPLPLALTPARPAAPGQLPSARARSSRSGSPLAAPPGPRASPAETMRKFNIRKVLDGLTAGSSSASQQPQPQPHTPGSREPEVQETLQSEHFQLCKVSGARRPRPRGRLRGAVPGGRAPAQSGREERIAPPLANICRMGYFGDLHHLTPFP